MGMRMVKPLKKRSMESIFLFLQGVLYVTFLALDVTGSDTALSNKIKYLVIILCFCYALLAGKGTVRFVKAAQLFTLLADLYLLLLDYYLYGVMVFILVQHLYSIRLLILKQETERVPSKSFAQETDREASKSFDQESDFQGKRVRQMVCSYLKRFVLQILGALCVCMVLAARHISLELLSVTSIYYFILILSNVVTAIRLAHATPGHKGNILYAWGMLLFLFCDINVGLYNLSAFILLPEQLAFLIDSVSSILMWTFYAPSQVLIAVSSRYAD